MKKKSADELIRECARDIVREIEHWKYINEHGCNDPHWPDGVNMNLTRNHIIYDKKEIARLCVENSNEFPEEYYLPTPPVVDDKYMANLKQKERVEFLRRMGDELTRGKNRYDDTQLKLT